MIGDGNAVEKNKIINNLAEQRDHSAAARHPTAACNEHTIAPAGTLYEHRGGMS